MRDLLRSRAAAVRQRQTARQQLKAFMLRHGCGYTGMKAWSRTHLRWLSDQKFDSHRSLAQNAPKPIIRDQPKKWQVVPP
jgi:transposase